MIEYRECVLRVGAVAACGLLVGIDREIKSKPLGARACFLSTALDVITGAQDDSPQ